MKVDMHRMFIRQFLFALLVLPLAYGANAQDLKVLISADMEGVAGAVDGAQRIRIQPVSQIHDCGSQRSH